jgi:hypothetical protein
MPATWYDEVRRLAAMDLCSVEILVAERLGFAPSECVLGPGSWSRPDQQPLRIYR